MIQNSPIITEAKQKIVDDLLKELPSDSDIQIELPSECRVYKLPDPEAPITLRPMTFEDEKNMLGQSSDTDPVNLILSRCASNINISDLLPMDKFYLIMKLREISYGDDYDTLLICSKCRAENPVSIKISELNVNPVPDDFCDPIEVELPTIGKKANVRLPRVRDEKLLTNPKEMIDQLWRFVRDIDGHTDNAVIAAVINKLPLREVKRIINAMKTDFGVDTKVKLNCNNCKEVSVVDLPFDANFFDVN